MRTLLFILLLIPYIALADTWVVGNVASYHTNPTEPHNNKNWGVGVETNVDFDTNYPIKFALGQYKNSELSLSHYVGFMVTPIPISENFRAGFFVGAVDGYPSWNNKHF